MKMSSKKMLSKKIKTTEPVEPVETTEPIIGRLGLLDETLNAGSPAKEAILKVLNLQGQVEEAKQKKLEAEAALNYANAALATATKDLAIAQPNKIYLVGGKAIRVIAKEIKQEEEPIRNNYISKQLKQSNKKYSLEVIDIAE